MLSGVVLSHVVHRREDKFSPTRRPLFGYIGGGAWVEHGGGKTGFKQCTVLFTPNPGCAIHFINTDSLQHEKHGVKAYMHTDLRPIQIFLIQVSQSAKVQSDIYVCPQFPAACARKVKQGLVPYIEDM